MIKFVYSALYEEYSNNFRFYFYVMQFTARKKRNLYKKKLFIK